MAVHDIVTDARKQEVNALINPSFDGKAQWL
jgi:hypothetical protein